MKLEKQIVYLPVKEGVLSVSHWDTDNHIQDVESVYGYFFTSEQLNQLLSEIIKDTLDTAAEKANLESRLYSKFQGKIEKTENLGQEVNLEGQLYLGIEEKSITNTAEQTFNKFKV